MIYAAYNMLNSHSLILSFAYVFIIKLDFLYESETIISIGLETFVIYSLTWYLFLTCWFDLNCSTTIIRFSKIGNRTNKSKLIWNYFCERCRIFATSGFPAKGTNFLSTLQIKVLNGKVYRISYTLNTMPAIKSVRVGSVLSVVRITHGTI